MINNFRSQLASSEILLGTIVSLPTPSVAELLAELGFDWLFVDSEHGPLETGDLLAILHAVANRVPCIVRVPEAAEVPIKKVLDLGAAGIIVPQVNTAEQAANAVRFARYAPEGERGVGVARAHGYGTKFQEYMRAANNQTVVVVQVEHKQAVENIDSIVQVPGIDAVFIGPYDLSSSYGKMGQLDDPGVIDAIEQVTTTCLNAKMPLGYFGLTAESVQPYIARGYRLIVVGTDATLLVAAAKETLDKLR